MPKQFCHLSPDWVPCLLKLYSCREVLSWCQELRFYRSKGAASGGRAFYCKMELLVIQESLKLPGGYRKLFCVSFIDKTATRIAYCDESRSTNQEHLSWRSAWYSSLYLSLQGPWNRLVSEEKQSKAYYDPLALLRRETHLYCNDIFYRSTDLLGLGRHL